MAGSISSVSGSYDTAQIQQMRSLAADRLLKAVDTNQDGKITQDELSKAVDSRGGQQGPTTAELFKQLDQGNKGYITKQDLEDGLAKADQRSPPAGPPPGMSGGGGPPPAGADGGGGAAAPAGSSSSASSGASTTTTYDPADLNQDGIVTMQERLQYAAKLYAAQEQAPSSSKQASVYA